MKPWTYHDVAHAVGLAVLGQDIGDISETLKRTPEDVRDTLADTLPRVCPTWLEEIQHELKKSVPVNEPAPPEEPVEGQIVFRRYSVNDRLELLSGTRCSDVTALVLGDPPPGRSALSQKQNSVPKSKEL